MTTATFNPTKAHQRYKLLNGVRVCGATTILDVINKPALLKWAWECGMNGEDYRKKAGKAADIGTIAHWLIECHLKGLSPDISQFAPADMERAETAFLKFLEWWDEENWQFLASELQLVHESERYGGTLDIMGQRNGEVALIDIKTSKAIYDDHWFQVAAYGRLWSEATVVMVGGIPQPRDVPPVKKIRHIIARFGKKDAASDFEVVRKDDMAPYWETFMAAKTLYVALRNIRGQ